MARSVFGKKAKRFKEEFENACLEHMRSLYNAASRLTQNSADAEELVQDTYLKAFRFSNRFEPGTNLRAWLFRIQTNTFINNYRRKEHERRYQERVHSDPLYDEILDREAWAFAANPESHAFSRFFKEELELALDRLPQEFRLVIVLSDVEGFSYKEISEMVCCPIGTVMSRLHRGRRMLQRELVDYAVEMGIGTEREENGDSKLAEISAYRKRLKR